MVHIRYEIKCNDELLCTILRLLVNEPALQLGSGYYSHCWEDIHLSLHYVIGDVCEDKTVGILFRGSIIMYATDFALN